MNNFFSTLFSIGVSVVIMLGINVYVKRQEFNTPISYSQQENLLSLLQDKPELKGRVAAALTDGEISSAEYLGIMAASRTEEEKAEIAEKLKKAAQ